LFHLQIAFEQLPEFQAKVVKVCYDMADSLQGEKNFKPKAGA
jgi:hypothetical protein